MRIAVYAIAKNEEQHIRRWYESAKDADEVILVDTGSEDDTVAIAESLGIKTYQIHLNRWRFDVARNASLSLVPEDVDYCIALDLDEYLMPGWRAAFDKIDPATDRVMYRMTYVDTMDRMWYWANRCHRRLGYEWTHEIHERLVFECEETVQYLDFDVHHDQDMMKERNYLEMLERCTKEHPNDLRYALYYARELLADDQLKASHDAYLHWLSMPGKRTNIELADAYRYMGWCNVEPIQDFFESLQYYKRRETYMDLAKFYNDRNMWKECIRYCDEAFKITEKPLEITSFEYAWGPSSYSMASMAAMNLQEYAKASRYVMEGLSYYEDNEQLKNNLKLIDINEMLSLAMV